jgi:hypothetical protein
MTYRYLIYRTDFNDTIIRESAVSGTTGINENELYTDFIIPAVQPFYLWMVSGGTVVIPNTETWIDAWSEEIAPIPTKHDLATIGYVTGTTFLANYYNKTEINAYSAATKSLIDLKAPITSPTFLVSACAPTPVADSNNTCIATTAFITACQVGTATPLMNGLAAVGTSLRYSRQDHIHPRDITKVNVSGDTMTGTLKTSGGFLATGLVSGSTVYSSTCLCSAGMTRLVGAATAASALNVSGDTRIVGSTYLGNIITGASQQNFVVIDSVSKKLASSETKFHKYGTEYQLASDLTSTSTNSTTPVAKVTMTTTSLPAGTYKITVHWLWSRDSAANSARFNVTIGGTAQGTRTTIDLEAKDIQDRAPETRIFYAALSGVNTIVFNHWGESVANSTTTSDATIELIRVN